MAEARHQAAPPAALRVLGRRGVRPARLRALRRTRSTASQLGEIYANLNFDMVGSPNYVRFVYDGDNSDFEPDGVDASRARPAPAQIEGVFERLLRRPGPGQRPDAVRRPLGLRPVHRGRHPRRRPVHRRRGRSRPPSRPPSTAAPPASPTTRATTRRATRSTNLSTKALDEMADAAAHATLTLATLAQRPVRGRQPQGLDEEGQAHARGVAALATPARGRSAGRPLRAGTDRARAASGPPPASRTDRAPALVSGACDEHSARSAAWR